MKRIRFCGAILATLGLTTAANAGIFDFLGHGSQKSCGCAPTCQPQACRPAIKRPCGVQVYTYQRAPSALKPPCCNVGCAPQPSCGPAPGYGPGPGNPGPPPDDMPAPPPPPEPGADEVSFEEDGSETAMASADTEPVSVGQVYVGSQQCGPQGCGAQGCGSGCCGEKKGPFACLSGLFGHKHDKSCAPKVHCCPPQGVPGQGAAPVPPPAPGEVNFEESERTDEISTWVAPAPTEYVSQPCGPGCASGCCGEKKGPFSCLHGLFGHKHDKSCAPKYNCCPPQAVPGPGPAPVAPPAPGEVNFEENERTDEVSTWVAPAPTEYVSQPCGPGCASGCCGEKKGPFSCLHGLFGHKHDKSCAPKHNCCPPQAVPGPGPAPVAPPAPGEVNFEESERTDEISTWVAPGPTEYVSQPCGPGCASGCCGEKKGPFSCLSGLFCHKHDKSCAPKYNCCPPQAVPGPGPAPVEPPAPQDVKFDESERTDEVSTWVAPAPTEYVSQPCGPGCASGCCGEKKGPFSCLHGLFGHKHDKSCAPKFNCCPPQGVPGPGPAPVEPPAPQDVKFDDSERTDEVSTAVTPGPTQYVSQPCGPGCASGCCGEKKGPFSCLSGLFCHKHDKSCAPKHACCPQHAAVRPNGSRESELVEVGIGTDGAACGPGCPTASQGACCKADPCVIAELIYQSQTACYADDRADAIDKLGDYDCACNPEILGAMVYALNDADEDVRKEAADELGDVMRKNPCCCNPQVVSALTVALGDCDKGVRRQAEEGLAACGHAVIDGGCYACVPAGGVGPAPGAPVPPAGLESPPPPPAPEAEMAPPAPGAGTSVPSRTGRQQASGNQFLKSLFGVID